MHGRNPPPPPSIFRLHELLLLAARWPRARRLRLRLLPDLPDLVHDLRALLQHGWPVQLAAVVGALRGELLGDRALEERMWSQDNFKWESFLERKR